EGLLVELGVMPDYAETGYGYIRRGTARQSGGYELQAFVEKPDPDMAQHYLEAGDSYWNSGMFMFRASVYRGELRCHAPDILAACEAAVANVAADLDFCRVDAEAFAACPANSVDYAV